jgi:Protein of unknown function (DUF2809)
MRPWLRVRIPYVALAVGTIVVGLTVHVRGGSLPPRVRDVLGDALWAVMMTWIISAVAPAVSLWWRAGAALAVCFVVEMSQLIHTPALDALRETMPGHLVLGSGFDARDFGAYAAGVLAAVIFERTIKPRA